MSKPSDYFERVYVISLWDDGEAMARRALLEVDLERRGWGGDVEYVKACRGDLLGPPGWWKPGAGSWGCLLSHLAAVERAVEEDAESVLILEDDVVWHRNAEEWLDEFMVEMSTTGALGDWGQIYLGGDHLRPVKERLGERVWRPGNVNRTHAYALHRRAFGKFVGHVMYAPDYIRHPGWHIDHQLGRAHERGLWNVYCPSWWLAGQRAGLSSISAEEQAEKWWQPAEFASKLPFVQIPGAWRDHLPGGVGDVVHAGWNMRRDAREDIGLAGCVGDRRALAAWAKMIAREALELGRLPGWQCDEVSAAEMECVWPAGCVRAEIEMGGELYRLADYPANGLMGGPWGEDAPVREEKIL